MTRTNLVDAYDNRSVVAKLVNMEERISGAETSVEASAEAAASSASAAAASQAAAKTSETSAKASADTAAATLSNTVDLSSKQIITGAKTFAGDTAITGSFITSGNTEMSSLDIDTGKLTVGSGGSADINGTLTAPNTSNNLKVANHDSVLTGNDVLSAKDIMTPNGAANNLVHTTGTSTLLAPTGALKLKSRLIFSDKIYTGSTASNWQEIIRVTNWGNNTNLELEIFGAINGQRSLTHGKWWFVGGAVNNFQGGVCFVPESGGDITIDFLKARINADGTMSVFADMSNAWSGYRISVTNLIREDDSIDYKLRSDLTDLKDTNDLTGEGTMFSKYAMKMLL